MEVWAESMRLGLEVLGTRVESFQFPRELTSIEARRLIELMPTARFKRRIRASSAEVVVVGAGGNLLARPELVQSLARLAESRGTRVLMRWGDCRWILRRKILPRIPVHQLESALSALRGPEFLHLSMSDDERAGLRDILGIAAVPPIGNVRPEALGRYIQPPVPDDPPVVVNVASIQPRKGPDLFGQVARLVRAQRPDVVFVWAGKAARSPWTKAVIQEYGEDVQFIGPTTKPLDVFRSSSVVLMSSRSEAASGAVLEAMSLGRHVVAFAGTGTPYLIGSSGTIVPSGDVVAASNAVLRIVASPPASRVSYAALERFRTQFAPEPAAQRLMNVVHDVVG